MSVTERVMAKLPAAPCQERQSVGPVTIRPRVGFKPMVPVQEAGIRMEPPPSLAAARGRSPAATAAPAPPGRTTRVVSKIPRVMRITIHLGIGYVFKAKFGIIGLTDNHKSRRFQGLGKVAGLGGNLVGKEAVGVGRRQAGFGLPQALE